MSSNYRQKWLERDQNKIGGLAMLLWLRPPTETDTEVESQRDKQHRDRDGEKLNFG